MLQILRLMIASFVFLAGLFLLGILLSGCAASERIRDGRMVIDNVTIVSPERAAPLNDAWVVVEDGWITAIGVGDAPQAGRVLDFSGSFVIPGLIDSHVHLYHATGLKRRLTSDYAALYAAYMDQMPRSYLYFGFTSLVELNADFGTNDEFNAAPLHPRLFHCGQGVVLPDGFMALEVPGERFIGTFPGFLIDSYRDGFVPADADPAEHTPAAVVRHVKSQGGRCLKLYYEEALWWPGEEPLDFQLPTIEVIRDVTRAARAQAMPVLLHATTPNGMHAALEAGVDILAHGMWEWPDQAFDAPEPLPEYQMLMDRLACSPIKLQPTFNTIRNTQSLFRPEILEDPRWSDVVPEAYLHYLQTDAQAQRDTFLRMFSATIERRASDRPLAELQEAFNQRYERLIGRAHELGAGLLFGTDTAVGGFGWGSPPGLAGYWEIQTWARVGIPLDEILAAMTIDNATAFGLENELGTVEVGKRADLVILRQNPLQSAAAYDTISHTVIDGVLINREQLSVR